MSFPGSGPRPLQRRLVSLCLPLLTLGSCVSDRVTGPSQQPPFLAILLRVDAVAGVATGGPYAFRVRELSGTLGFDTTFRASARDTVIIPVAAATYRVDISDVPPTCGIRDGSAQAIVVPPNTNTSVIRFSLTCAPSLVVAAFVDGFRADSDFVVTVRDSVGRETAAILPANDTIRLDGLAPGRYDVILRHVSDNCTITSDGGATVPVFIRPAGGAFVPFRVVCASPAQRPRIALLAGSYSGGSFGYVIRAVDPDRDIEQTFVDITDCNQRTVLPGGGQRRSPFSGQPNVSGRDTAVIVGAYDIAIPDSLLANRCLGAWVADSRGNTSAYVEMPIRPSNAAQRPVVNPLNGRRNGTRSILVDVSVSDPNADFVGLFVVYLLRDGVLTTANGQPDRVVLQPAGTLGTTIPEFLVNIGFGNFNDYFGVIVYAVDRAGNLTRVEDLQLDI